MEKNKEQRVTFQEPPPPEPVPTQSPTSGRWTMMKRRCLTMNPANVHIWAVKEWLAFLFLLILGVYAIGGLSGNVLNVKTWTHPKYPGEPKLALTNISIMISAQAILLVGVICGLVCLFLRRDLIGFILSLIFPFITFIMLLYIGGYSAYVGLGGSSVITEMFEYVEKEISQKDYARNFHTMEATKQCCGIRGYKDYDTFGPIEGLPKWSVPKSCCTDSLVEFFLEDANLTACTTNATQKSEWALGTTSLTRGCGHLLFDQKYRRLYIGFVVEAVFVIIIIILLLLILLRLVCVWYKNEHKKPEWIEQENDTEDAVVPGTPEKSYISDLEDGVFYAP